MTTVSEYLGISGLSPEAFAERADIKPGAVRLFMNRQIPPKWQAAIENSIRAQPVSLDELNRVVDAEPEPENWETLTERQSEHPPQPPPDAKLSAPPSTAISFRTVRGYIVAIYDGGAGVARKRGDFLAADTIERYTPQFADAWIAYLETKPEILQWFTKLQIGTPLGDLIGVHVIAAGSYVLARQTAISMAERAAEERAAAEENGKPARDGPPSFVG